MGKAFVMVGSSSIVRRPDSKGKKIEYEERRDRLQKVLEKRRAKSTTNHHKDTPNNTENGKKRTENSKQNTVYSGNSKRLNSEQSLISEHFW